MSVAVVATETEPVSKVWIARFSLLWFGFWLAELVPLNLVLPDQLAGIDPVHELRDFGILNGSSGIAALIALPVCGALCDRSRSRFGRRRVWMAGGTIAYAVALSSIGLVHSWVAVATLWTITIVGVSAATAGLTAVMADRVPDHQRGVVSGAIYGPQALGVVVGVGVLSAFTPMPKQAAKDAGKAVPLPFHTITVAYIAMALVLVVCAVGFIRRYEEIGSAEGLPSLSFRGILDSLWISPKENPDFAWAFGGRTLVNLANSFGTTFLIFFLRDDLHRPDPVSDLLVLTLVYLVFTLAATALSGILSDRLGRRRIFVAVAAGFQGAAGLLIGIDASFGTGLVGAGAARHRLWRLHGRGPGARHRGAPRRDQQGEGPRHHEHRVGGAAGARPAAGRADHQQPRRLPGAVPVDRDRLGHRGSHGLQGEERPVSRRTRTSFGKVDADLLRGIGPGEGFWIRVVRVIMAPIWAWCVRPVWRGMANIPETGPVILAPNHMTEVDPLILVQAIAYGGGRIPRFLAKASLFKPPGTGTILTHAKQIPVYRQSEDPASALRDAATALEAGECVVLYPEGTVTGDPDKWPMVGRTGLVRLALQTGAPVVPVAHWGDTEFRRTGRFRPHHAVTVAVSVGPPVDLSGTDDLHVATERVMDAITDLMRTLREGEPPAQRFNPRPKA